MGIKSPGDRHLICVVGPTAIGKTTLAIHIASAFTTEIISADSRQFFKEMKIGTAVPHEAELNAVPHHFVQNKSIFENYSVGDFERDAINTLERLFEKYEKLVLVGGSGLYIDAVIHGLDDFPEVDEAIRISLDKRFKDEGISVLQNELKEVDPAYYELADIRNPHRLIRALSVYHSSGKPYSSFRKGGGKPRLFDTILVGIKADRETVYTKINDRVDQMIRGGLVEEARSLYPHRHLNALNTVGYKELFEFFDGNISLEQAVEAIKQNTRRFAKRQETWFRKNKEIRWFDYAEKPEVIIEHIQKKAL